MATIEVTEANFNATIENNDIVILDWWASWCGPCRIFGPIFEEASNEHPDIVFGKLNTEEQQALAATFQVQSIPTLMVFREQVLVFNQAGALPKEALDDLVTQVRALDMTEVHAKTAATETESGS